MIALLLTPLARYAFITLAIMAVAGGLYAKGRHDGRMACESRVAAAIAAEQLRQAAVRAKALDNAAERELAARADANLAEQKVADYEAELARQPAPEPGTCAPDYRLRGGDVERLRSLQ